GQAVHRDGRHLARELPAEKLPDGLSHPARVLLPARAGVPRMKSALCILVTLLAFTAAAQPYPSRPVRLVVPLSPGGFADTPTRILAARLSEQCGKQFYVENRPGAGGTIGRSEERRVGKEWRCRWATEDVRQKEKRREVS